MLDEIFGTDGYLYRILNKIIEWILLNAIFLITCIPIITIGSAVTALYGTSRNMIKGEGYLVRGYFKMFRENFKKSVIVWAAMLLMLLVLVADFRILGGGKYRFAAVAIMAVFILWDMVFTYIFPLMSKFDNTIKNSVMNSIIISMTRIGFTIPLLILNLLPIIIWFIGGRVLVCGVSIYAVLGYSLTAYLNTHILEHVFKKYIRE